MPARASPLDGPSALDAGLVVLLTATIRAKPDLPDAAHLLLDPAVRAASYRHNVAFWLTRHPWIRRLVLAENSGASLESWASVGGNDFPGRFGKGFGEAELLRRAFRDSGSLRSATLVAKVTGLQRVQNLDRLARRIPASARWVVDLRDHSVYRRLGSRSSGTWCDTRCFFVAPDFFERELGQVHRAHAEGHFYLEMAYYDAVKTRLGEPGVVARFPVEPDYRGIAGHWSKNYSGAKQRAKYWARRALRRLAPGLWI
jgi:hypothetical protein